MNPHPEEQAKELWRLGTTQLVQGDVQGAISLFERSLEVHPTAEGYTFRGWAVSFLGRYEEAIADCRRAIEIDPEFGNPYNDIGCYLMQQGELEEAIPWLEKAKQAKRYDPRHFPYLNLGHIYARVGEPMKALDEFLKALELHPGDEVATAAIEALEFTEH